MVGECSILFPGHCNLVLAKSCREYISYILWGRNLKFGMWIDLRAAKCHILFLGHCDFDLWPQFQTNH